MALLCIVPSKDRKKIEDFAGSYSFDVFEIYDPDDPNFRNLPNRKRLLVIGRAMYKLHGDLFLNMDVGVELSDEDARSLFDIALQLHQSAPKLSPIVGKGYKLTRKPE